MDKTCYMSCELKVDTKTPGWHKTITRMIERIKEVSYTIDAQTGVATISGRIDPKTLLRLLEKVGKHAQLIKVDSGSNEPYEPNPPIDEVNGYESYPQSYGYIPTAPVQQLPPVPPMGYYYHDHETQCSIM